MYRILVCLVITMLSSGCARNLASSLTSHTESTPAAAGNPSDTIRSITKNGWLTTVWNEKPHYTLTDDQGKTFTLVFTEEVIQRIGGVLAFDRKRVHITGKPLTDPPDAIEVIEISLEK